MAEPTDNSTQESSAILGRQGIIGSSHGQQYHSGLDNTDESEQEEEEFYESDESANLTWISWFCSLKGHEYFCEVPEEFIEDEFNLTGLSQTVNYYVEALDMILDIEDENDDPLDAEEIEAIDNSSEILYGLIHARYILTRNGLHQMAYKYENGDFGVCPRYACDGVFLIPCGRTDVPERDSVKLFCPSCLDIYAPPSSRYHKIDGAYFGTTFPHLFFQAFPSLVPEEPTPIYTPQIYGFAINERSKAGPRMQWLRMRPENFEDGDEEDDGNTTDSQSYVEAQAIGIEEDSRGGQVEDEAHGTANSGNAADEGTNTTPAHNEDMDIATDRADASRTTTPAVAPHAQVEDKDDDEQNDQVMDTANNSPKATRSSTPSEDRRRDEAGAALNAEEAA